VLRLDGDAFFRGERRPKLFQIIEAADLGTEQVDNHVARIDENPVALGHAFNAEIGESCRFKLFDKLLGNGGNMPIGTAAGYDHLVGQRALAIEIYRSNVLGFGVIKTSEDRG
jgi:hypothetical protein